MTQTTQANGTRVQRDGAWLRFSKDRGFTWSRWFETTLEGLVLKVEHGIELDKVIVCA
jgi:hypothetical protein